MAVFYTYKTTMEEEKMAFLKCLYHDKRNGQAIRLRKEEDEISQYSTFVLDDLAATGTDMANLYTSVNSFKGGKRTSASLFNYCSIFIDIDCHAMDNEGIKEAKRRTVELLEEAYASGKLAEPTMITDTGRGFGLQYVLSRSIANIAQTEKQQLFFKRVRKSLFERYSDILAVDPMAAQPDASALDDARVCRLPGTYNQSAGTYCRLIGMSGTYYELSAIVKDCHLWTWVNDEEYQKKKEEKERKKKERIAAGKVIPFGEIRFPFLSARVDQLMKLQDLRGKNCTDDCREQLLFIAYSAYVQLDRETAVDKLQELNARFTDPLDQAELDHIVEETDASVGFDHRGFYKLKNSYLVERLNLNEDEIKALGLDMGWQRTAARQSARQGKLEKREKVIELLRQVELLTYDEIAKLVGVSKRKVCTIAKEENLMRYRKAAGRYNEASEDKADIISIDRLKQGDTARVTESAKNAVKSVCVSRGDFPASSLLSTSVSSNRCAGHDVAVVAVPLLDTAAVLPTLIGYAHNILGLSLLRLYNKCMLIDSLKDAALMRLKKSLPMYDVKNLTAFYKALSEDGTFLARLLVSIPAPSGWSEMETSSERQNRLDFYLFLYKDERFDLITSTPEYLYRLNYAVLKQVKMTFMQVKRLHREYVYVEKRQIAATDIQECFNSLTYKDIVILCERIAHQGKIQTMKKPFFYIIGCVYKYRHPDLAEEQAERVEQGKKFVGNSFCNFEQRNIDFGLIEANAVRELLGQPLLSEEEYRELMQIGSTAS